MGISVADLDRLLRVMESEVENGLGDSCPYRDGFSLGADDMGHLSEIQGEIDRLKLAFVETIGEVP